MPFTIALVVYIGLSTSNLVFSTSAFQSIMHGGSRLFWCVVISIASVGLAVYGQDLWHLVQRWLTYLYLFTFTVLTVGAIVNIGGRQSLPHLGYTFSRFLGQFAAAAGLLISQAIYVAASQMVAWTHLGAIASTGWQGALGALFATRLLNVDAAGSLQQVGNGVLPYLGDVTLLMSAIGLVTLNGVNIYGSMLSALSIIDSFRIGTVSYRLRLASITPAQFVATFSTFLTPL